MKKLFFFALTGVAAILAGCTKTETVEIPDSRAIDFSGAYIGNAVETRTQQNPENITDASITEFIVYGGYNGTMTDVFNGESVTGTSGGSWTYTNTEYWVDGKTYDFAAYAPAAVSSTVAADNANKALSFTNFTSNADNQNDLLYAHVTVPTVNPSTQGAVMFNFEHALSKIRFTLTNAIDGKLTIDNFKVYGMNSQGDYTYQTGSSMGWDEDPCLHIPDHLQRGDICTDIVYEREAVLIQRLAAGKAVSEVYSIIRGTEPDHIEEVARKRDDGHALRQHGIGQRLRIA